MSTTNRKLANNVAETLTKTDKILKSTEDVRQYRALKLNNGLKVLLISDPTTDKSAASLDLNIGSMSNPDHVEGLAHFCEHMLFMGTEKYPDEKDYHTYLQEHGGGANAYTSPEHTNYQFDVNPKYLEGALDRFAQFFISPLFTESATEREAHAVDSEFGNYLQEDPDRLYQLGKSLSDPSHPFSKFHIGSKETLLNREKDGVNVRQELLKFHNSFYSSNLMSLCILGQEDLTEMEEKFVKGRFDVIADKNLTTQRWEKHPYGPEQTGFKVKVVPVKDIRVLHVTFPIPDMHDYYRSQPASYLSHLLGHEGAGSLLSELKRRGWANGLSAGANNGCRGFDFFSVDVDLSPEGLENTDEILKLLFEYLAMLRKSGSQQWVFDECAKLNEINFKFLNKKKPIRYVVDLADALHYYPAEEALKGAYIMDQYRPDLIEMVLARLNPRNMVVAQVGQKYAKELEGQLEKERWFGIDYRKDPIDEHLLVDLENIVNGGTNFPEKKFRLPDENEFIPSDFQLYPTDNTLTQREENCQKKGKFTLPVVVRDDERCRVWCKQDDEFLLPKCAINIHLRNPVVYRDPEKAAQCQMFCTLMQDSLTEYVYSASLAGLSYTLMPGVYGIGLTSVGFNQKQSVFVKRLVEKLATFEPDPERFKVLLEYYQRQLRNTKHNQPYNHVGIYSNLILSERQWSNNELLQAAEDLTLNDIIAFRKEFLKNLHVESYVHGNTNAEEAIKITEQVLDVVKDSKPISPSMLAMFHELDLPSGCRLLYEATNETHPNSASTLIFQIGVENHRLSTLVDLFCQLCEEEAFDVLRTKEQLGYIVYSHGRRSHGTRSMQFLVQGEKDPLTIQKRVEAFIKQFKSDIESMPADEFDQNKEALAARKLERPKKLPALANRLSGEISGQHYDFERELDEVEQLSAITKDELLAFVDKYISVESPDAKILAVRVRATNCQHSASAEDQQADKIFNRIDDIEDLKSQCGLLPRPKPRRKVPPAGKKIPPI